MIMLIMMILKMIEAIMIAVIILAMMMTTQIVRYDKKLLKFAQAMQNSQVNPLTCKDVIVAIFAFIFLSKANIPRLIILAWCYSLKKIIFMNLSGAKLVAVFDCSNPLRQGLET